MPQQLLRPAPSPVRAIPTLRRGPTPTRHAASRSGRDAQAAHVRLTDSGLDFRVDVRILERAGRWLAVADLADEADIGTGEDPRQALRAALAALGEPIATEMAEAADLT
jgi:hypothetical protein